MQISKAMERLYIRGRLLELFRRDDHVSHEQWNGARAFTIAPDDLARMLEEEFGVTVPAERLPDLLTVNWLVDVVHELAGDELVM